MSDGENPYKSFLLRQWMVKVNNHTTWRFSLESSQTGTRWGFADVEALCAFLRQSVESLLGSESNGGGETGN